MLLIKTYIASSLIPGAGLGLFAAEFIPKGTRIWEFTQNFDSLIEDSVVKKLHKTQKEFIETYAYFNTTRKVWILCVDNDRFINHSETPNVADSIEEFESGFSIAARNIQMGEELTCDYRLFDAAYVDKLSIPKTVDSST